MTISFEEFRYDPDARVLFVGDRPVSLPKLAFDLLGLLLAERPRAVSKQELRDRLWPDRVVSDAAVASVVRDLRAALRDQGRRARFVRTVHGFGFAFSGNAVEEGTPHAAEPASLPCRLVYGRREVALGPGESIVGRAADAALSIGATGVSRHHARFIVRPGGVSVEDLGSKNGTWVGDSRVTGLQPLSDGDEIRLGRHVSLIVRMSAPADPTATEA